MTKPLSKHAYSIQKIIDSHQLNCQVIELPSTTHTAKEAALAIGCTIHQIVKSLIFETKSSHEPVLILAEGATRVKESIIEAILNTPITKASAEFVKENTGFSIGGVPPFGHKHPIPHLFIDKQLLQHHTVWAATGTPNAVFSIETRALIKVLSPLVKVIELT
jgi:prolyl-tRNA editing enzyme YbaK/EbsC (Cys-tRNA(Pro) deacylase)